jgi:hypothetical protein
MATSFDNQLEALFPNLVSTEYEVTSPADPRYNCIAWAANDQGRWWEPDSMAVCYWPASVSRHYTLAAYRQAFESLGYVPCEDYIHENGYTRVVLFANGDRPTHASRELRDYVWTSKLGRSVDISHELHAVSGQIYGNPASILRRVETTAG